MLTVSCRESNAPQFKPCNHSLGLESTIQELSLYELQIEFSCLCYQVTQKFEANPLLPGIILLDRDQFAGMISRRRYFEFMSRPYGLELFAKRPLKTFYNFTETGALILPGETLIVEAVRQSLQRPPDLLYEPIVVKTVSQGYCLLDVHQLLFAHSQIHKLAIQILNEQTQAHLLQTEKMASLGRMVVEVAHEIRNPINCVSGNLPFLSTSFGGLVELIQTYRAENAQPSTKIREVIAKIELGFLLEDLPRIMESISVSSERLTQIVESLHNFSHKSEAQRQPTDIHEGIENTLLILNNRLKHGIEVIKNYEPLPLVSCYSSQISQVFMNLISNAIDALMDRAADKSNASLKDWQPRLEIATAVLKTETPPSVLIRIADNGCGIPPQIQERIFEAFFTTKPVGKGTGLGLAISHQIVTQKHGGQLRVHSQPGMSTEFEILLPLI